MNPVRGGGGEGVMNEFFGGMSCVALESGRSGMLLGSVKMQGSVSVMPSPIVNFGVRGCRFRLPGCCVGSSCVAIDVES